MLKVLSTFSDRMMCRNCGLEGHTKKRRENFLRSAPTNGQTTSTGSRIKTNLKRLKHQKLNEKTTV